MPVKVEKWSTRSAAGILIAVLGGPALAQENEWSFMFSPSIWTSGASSSVETRFGTLDAEVGIEDVVSATDFALWALSSRAMTAGASSRILVYSDPTEQNETPFGVLFSEARVDTDLTMVTGYAGYRFYRDDRVALDILGGARTVRFDIDVAFEPGVLSGQSFGVSESWIDPVIAHPVRGNGSLVCLGTR